MNKYIFFFNDTATTEIYTLSLHDALPISYGDPNLVVAGIELGGVMRSPDGGETWEDQRPGAYADCHNLAAHAAAPGTDRKSTRLNSSHANISYAVFCLKKKIFTYICSTYL